MEGSTNLRRSIVNSNELMFHRLSKRIFDAADGHPLVDERTAGVLRFDLVRPDLVCAWTRASSRSLIRVLRAGIMTRQAGFFTFLVK